MARGGKRLGAGRPKGSLNKATGGEKQSLSDLAKCYAPDALAALHRIATRGQSEAAVVSASTAILDRAFGKPRQAQPDEEQEDPMAKIIKEICRRGSAAPIQYDNPDDDIEP